MSISEILSQFDLSDEAARRVAADALQEAAGVETPECRQLRGSNALAIFRVRLAAAIDPLQVFEDICQEYLGDPDQPVVGRGNSRVEFGHPRRGVWEAVWACIPKRHKHVLRYSTGSSLAWRGTTSNIVISPEAGDLVQILEDYI